MPRDLELKHVPFFDIQIEREQNFGQGDYKAECLMSGYLRESFGRMLRASLEQCDESVEFEAAEVEVRCRLKEKKDDAKKKGDDSKKDDDQDDDSKKDDDKDDDKKKDDSSSSSSFGDGRPFKRLRP